MAKKAKTVCPTCGTCPTCGAAKPAPLVQFVPYPVYTWPYPYTPYYWPIPVITSGGWGASSSIGLQMTNVGDLGSQQSLGALGVSSLAGSSYSPGTSAQNVGSTLTGLN